MSACVLRARSWPRELGGRTPWRGDEVPDLGSGPSCPGDRSTPVATSTPHGGPWRIASATLSGVRPPARISRSHAIGSVLGEAPSRRPGPTPAGRGVDQHGVGSRTRRPAVRSSARCRRTTPLITVRQVFLDAPERRVLRRSRDPWSCAARAGPTPVSPDLDDPLGAALVPEHADGHHLRWEPAQRCRRRGGGSDPAATTRAKIEARRRRRPWRRPAGRPPRS